MSDQGQRTEKPTQRRLDKARREGRFAVSREFAGAMEFGAFVAAGCAFSAGFFEQLLLSTREQLDLAFHIELTPRSLWLLFLRILRAEISPVLIFGTILVLCGLAAQLGVTRFGFATKKLAPDFQRWNPVDKLKELPGQNGPAFLQGLLLIPVFLYLTWWIVQQWLETYLSLPMMTPAAALTVVAASWRSFLWRVAGAILVLGAIDLVRQRRRFLRGLRMTKQELREEHKESEGNPQIKARIRRIQRDLARRSMMKEVPRASAIIVNPTHYSVALQYDRKSSAAPRVVAKGKNYLARRIREIAGEHQIPIVENPPLAQALYKSVDVGQEIPPHLYRAVAEILAYIFRVAHHRGRS
jgi:flagellar biosynthetic protein FlhB